MALTTLDTVQHFPFSGLPPSSRNFTTTTTKVSKVLSAFFLFLREYNETWLLHFHRGAKHEVPVPKNINSNNNNILSQCQGSLWSFWEKKPKQPNNKAKSWILFLWGWQITHIFIFIDIWRGYLAQAFLTNQVNCLTNENYVWQWRKWNS